MFLNDDESTDFVVPDQDTNLGSPLGIPGDCKNMIGTQRQLCKKHSESLIS